MKLALEIDGVQREVDFSSTAGIASLKVDESIHEAVVSQPENGLFVVLINGRVYQCLLDRTPSGAMEISANGRRINLTVRDRKHLRGGHAGSSGADGPASLVAPMPGKVVRVLRAEGDEVAAGQGVLVVEAMKMQNEVQSPRPGRVARICVRDGQTVNAGEVLAIIE